MGISDSQPRSTTRGKSDEQGVKDKAVLHSRRHVWAARSLIIGGVVLSLILLPDIFKPSLIIFSFLWVLNGAGQALIAIPSSTLLAEHTKEDERGRAYAAHFALTHACWLVTYPAIGHAATRWGAPTTFTAAGAVCLLVTAAAYVLGRGVSGAHYHRNSTK